MSTLLLLMLLQLLLLVMVVRLAVSVNISLPNCADHCGEVQIPYPFGIGHDCYYNKSYELTCSNSFTPPKLFLGRFNNVEVLDIMWPGRYSILDPRYNYESRMDQRLTVPGLQSQNLCRRSSNRRKKEEVVVVRGKDFQNSLLVYSSWDNVLLVEGCGGSFVIRNRYGDVLTFCTSLCGKHGVGYCEASLLPSLTDEYDVLHHDFDYYEISLYFEQSPASNSSCNMSAVLIERTSVKNFIGKLSGLTTFPTVLDWHMDSNDFFYCNFPYEGNPYLPDGCQVMEECLKCKLKQRDCELQDDGNGTARYIVCGTETETETWKKPLFKPNLKFGSSMGLVTFVLLFIGGNGLNSYLKRRRELARKANYFKRNGGLLLQQQLSCDEGIVERIKVYTITELEKATDKFNVNRILGHGGQGTVYKGMLMDGRIVAIKKSKKVDETQVEPFINEVVILSQINHRNVVGLLGCCLETEVPILVYEFIPNGTLYEHIQGGAGDAFHITWKMRLQIAAESAGAIAYLHSSSAAPIYHRDIKSTNILLDEKYRAKVSDFGTSRAITIEQTHVTTAVQGTYGYLDPEYFQSNQFTAKSDVYSFGVVLVELLTGKKPICPIGNGSWISLAVEFLSKMEDSRLSEILDSRILDEGKESEFIAVAELARKCLDMNGKLRPTMREISVQLDAIRSSQMPISYEAKTKENNHATTEVIHFNSSPLTRSTASPNDNPPARSIEIQPLMGRT